MADDRPLMIVGISATLAAETGLIVIGETTDGAEVRRLTQELEPDVLLLDLEICQPLIIETVAYLQQHCPTVKIVALTDGDTPLYDLMVAGVAGCILETESPKMIVQAIRTVVLGGTCFSQLVLKKLTQESSVESIQVKVSNLTDSELAILRLVIAGQSNRQIGAALKISEKRVEKYLKRLFTKLKVKSRVEAAVWGVQAGLVEGNFPYVRDNPPLTERKIPQLEVSLTERELQILCLIAQGWENSRIASELCLAKQTVCNYISRIYAGIGVTSRVGAVIWARERGLG